jgi:hypothetical protein
MLVNHNRPSKKRKESKALVSCIKRTGFEMFLCSGCEKRNLKCIVLDKENSNRCSKCVCQGVSYNVKQSLAASWHALEMEEDCLKRESETALCLAKENLSCHKQFKRQKKFLKSKGKEMLCCRLRTLDKLEEAEEREKQEEEKRAAKAAATLFVLANDLFLMSNPFARLKVPLLPPKV